jgi:hypothetical protein
MRFFEVEWFLSYAEHIRLDEVKDFAMLNGDGSSEAKHTLHHISKFKGLLFCNKWMTSPLDRDDMKTIPITSFNEYFKFHDYHAKQLSSPPVGSAMTQQHLRCSVKP